MTSRFVKLNERVAGRQIPLADFDLAKGSAAGTSLRLVEEFGLLEGEILGDLPSDGFPELAGSGLDAGKGGIFSSDIWVVQIDAEFFGQPFDNALIFVRPCLVEHAFILELRNTERGKNDPYRISKLAKLSY
jgi:hypothetical protein